MYYSDESSGSDSNDAPQEAGFPKHMLSVKEKIENSNYIYDQDVENLSPAGHIVRSETTTPKQDQYSDMSSEEEDLIALYSDMDENNDSDEFDSSVNYSEMFPMEEYEQRNNQMVVMNTRIEKAKIDLVGGRNQDYLGLARDYKIHRKYSDPQTHPPCVLCHDNSAVDVFFPCEHRCVCTACINKESFCDERDMLFRENGYNICPLCASVIKRMIPFDHGREVEKYWEWVEEVAPPLPPGFFRKFTRSAEVLHKVYIDKVEHDIVEESFCKQN